MKKFTLLISTALMSAAVMAAPANGTGAKKADTTVTAAKAGQTKTQGQSTSSTADAKPINASDAKTASGVNF
ncbi:hypothetical protein [Neisseria montereyensis]|uniref:Uncharacterized protein n=1 Tax=Neisseria montereyensis TaxID=2973938 RepID=A0ABT2FDR3_9NEIS|nr:hypothetical protein [Neisseria montereyensis]MCS4534354.1 hypothetical protein [Neisseria montereyensis]